MNTPLSPSLLDPETCGEDLAHNAQLFSALAPLHCSGCADYHIRNGLHRYSGTRMVVDRPKLIPLVSKIIADKATGSRQIIEIVIAGSADTAMLSMLAHAAAVVSSETLKRCRFTVIDRCRTPLLVCAEFASKYGLNFHFCQDDLMSAARPCTADIILIHSVLRFIPRADQAPFLRHLGRWLAPEGRLVISNRILFDDDGAEAKGEIRKRTAANKAVQEALAQGRLHLPESPEATLSRLERAIGDSEGRPGEFRSLDEFKSLIEESGLEVISVEDLFWDLTIGPSDLMRKRRAHAVLARPTPSRNYAFLTIS